MHTASTHDSATHQGAGAIPVPRDYSRLASVWLTSIRAANLYTAFANLLRCKNELQARDECRAIGAGTMYAMSTIACSKNWVPRAQDRVTLLVQTIYRDISVDMVNTICSRGVANACRNTNAAANTVQTMRCATSETKAWASYQCY